MDLVMFPILYIAAYAMLYMLIPICFGRAIPRPHRSVFVSALLLAALIELTFIITNQMENEFLGNRLLHMLGGGVLAFFLYSRVMRDTGVVLNRIPFFFLGVCIVSTLGVLNEHWEFFLQATHVRVFMWSMTDTWLDLASNSTGALLAGIPISFVQGRKTP